MHRTFRRLLSFGLLAAVGCASSPPDAPRRVSQGGTPDPTVTRGADDTSAYRAGDRVDLGSADATFAGPPDSSLGHSVALPGDLDGDGFDDIVLANSHHGATDESCAESPGVMACGHYDRHAVQVIYGGTHLRRGGLTGPMATLTNHFGEHRMTVSAAGDVDGDGRADFLVSLLPPPCSQGTTVLVYGQHLEGTHDLRSVGAQIRDNDWCTGFGAASGIGDIDGDGFADLAIAAHGDTTQTGWVHVVYGRPERLTGRVDIADVAAFRLRTVAFDTSFGFPSPAGDVDGDGLDDFFVWRGSEVLSAYLVKGTHERLAGPNVIDERAVRFFGEGVSHIGSVGDFDGDGRADLMAATGEGDATAAFLLYGRSDWHGEVDVRESADASIAQLGRGAFGVHAFADAGDTDGDGHRDVIFSGLFERGSHSAVHLLHGGPERLTGAIRVEETVTFLGRVWSLGEDTPTDGGAGSSLAGASDLDGDGLDDFIVGAPTFHIPAPTGGRVYLILGRDAQ